MNVIDEYDGNEESVAHGYYPTRDEGFKLHAFDSAVSDWGRGHNPRPPVTHSFAGPPLPSLTIEERRALLNSLKYEDRNHTFTSRLANTTQRPGPVRPHTSQATVSFTPVVLDESASVKAIAVSIQPPAQTHAPMNPNLTATANGSYRVSSSALDPSLPRFMQPTTSFLHSSPHASPARRPASAHNHTHTHASPHTDTPSRHLSVHSSPSPVPLSHTTHPHTPVRRASLYAADHAHVARTTPASPPGPPRVATPLRFGSPVQISGTHTRDTAHTAHAAHNTADATTRSHASLSHGGAPTSSLPLAQSRSGFLAPAALLSQPHAHTYAHTQAHAPAGAPERVLAPTPAAAQPISTTTATSRHPSHTSARPPSSGAPVAGPTPSTARASHARGPIDTLTARPPTHGLPAGTDARAHKMQLNAAQGTRGRSTASALTRPKAAARGASSARMPAPMPASKAETAALAPSRTFLAPTAASAAKALSPPPAASPLSPASQWQLTSDRAEREREEWAQQRVVPRARVLGELPQPRPVHGVGEGSARGSAWARDGEATAHASAGQSAGHATHSNDPAPAPAPAAPLRVSALSGRPDVVVPSLQPVLVGSTDARGAALMHKPSLQGRDYADIAALLPSHVPSQPGHTAHPGNMSFSGSSVPVRYSSFTDAPIYALPRADRHYVGVADTNASHTNVSRSSLSDADRSSDAPYHPQSSHPAPTTSRPLLDTSQAPGPRHVTAEDIRELVSLVGAAAAVKIVGVATVRAVVGEEHVDALCETPAHTVAGHGARHASGGGGGGGGYAVRSTASQRGLGAAASSLADVADINGVFPPAMMAGGTADDAARLHAILAAARAAALRGDSAAVGTGAGAATAQSNASVGAHGRDGEVPSVGASLLTGDASLVERSLGAPWYADEEDEEEALRTWRGEAAQQGRTADASVSGNAHVHSLAGASTASSPPRARSTPAVASRVGAASPLAEFDGSPITATAATTATTTATAAVAEAARQKQEEWVRKRAMLRERLQQRHAQEVAAAPQDKYAEVNTALGTSPAHSGGPTAAREGKRASTAVRSGPGSASGKRSRSAGPGTHLASAPQSSHAVAATSNTSTAATSVSLTAGDLKGLDTTIDGALARTAALENRAVRRASTAAKGSDARRRSGAAARASRRPASAVGRGRSVSTLAQAREMTSTHASRLEHATQTAGNSRAGASTCTSRSSPSEPAIARPLPDLAATVAADDAGAAVDIEVSLRGYGESLHSEEDFYAREDAPVDQRADTPVMAVMSSSIATPKPHQPAPARGPARTQALVSPAAVTAARKSTLTTPQPPRRHPDGSLVLPSPGLPLAARVGAAGVERLLRDISAQVQRELGPAMAAVDALEHATATPVAAAVPQSADAMHGAGTSPEDRLDASIADCRDVSKASLGPQPSARSVTAMPATSVAAVGAAHQPTAAENQSESEAAVLAQLTRHHMQDKSVGLSARARVALALLERARVKQVPAARAPSSGTVSKVSVPRSSARSSSRQRPGASMDARASDSLTAAADESRRDSARMGSRASTGAGTRTPAVAPARVAAGKGGKRAADGKALRARGPGTVARRAYDTRARQRAGATDTLDTTTTADAAANQSVSWFIGLEPASPTQPRKARRFSPQLTPKRPTATLSTDRYALEGDTDPSTAPTTSTGYDSSTLPDLPLPQAVNMDHYAVSARAVRERASSAHAVAQHRKRVSERDIPVEIFLPRSKPPRAVAGEDAAETRSSATVAASAEIGRHDFWESEASHNADVDGDALDVEPTAPTHELGGAAMYDNEAEVVYRNEVEAKAEDEDENEDEGDVPSYTHAPVPPTALSRMEPVAVTNTQHPLGIDSVVVRRGGRKEEHVSWAAVEAEVSIQPALSDASTTSSHSSTELSCEAADTPASTNKSPSDAAPVVYTDTPAPRPASSPAPVVADVSYLLQLLSTSTHAGDVSVSDIIDALARSRVPVAALPVVAAAAGADAHSARGADTAHVPNLDATAAALPQPVPVAAPAPLMPADTETMYVSRSAASPLLTPAAHTTDAFAAVDALAAVAAADAHAPHDNVLPADTPKPDATRTAGVVSPAPHAVPAAYVSAVDAAVADGPAPRGAVHLGSMSGIPSEQSVPGFALPRAQTRAQTHTQLLTTHLLVQPVRGALSKRRASVASSGGSHPAPPGRAAAASRRSSLGPEPASSHAAAPRHAPQRAATAVSHASQAAPQSGVAVAQRSRMSRPLVASEVSSPPLTRTGGHVPVSGHVTQASVLRTHSARASSAPAATRATAAEDVDESGFDAVAGGRVIAHASAQAPVPAAAHARGRAASPTAAARGRPLPSHPYASFAAAGARSASPLAYARHSVGSSPAPDSALVAREHAPAVQNDVPSSADSLPFVAEVSRWVRALLTDMQRTIAHYYAGARLSPMQLQAATGLASRDVRVSTLLRQYALMQAAHAERSGADEEKVRTQADISVDAPALQSTSPRPVVVVHPLHSVTPSPAAPPATASVPTRASVLLAREAPRTQTAPAAPVVSGEDPSTRALIDSLLQGVAALRRAEQGEDVDLDTTSRAVRKALGKDTSDFLSSFRESDLSQAVDVDISSRASSALPSERADANSGVRADMPMRASHYVAATSPAAQVTHRMPTIAMDPLAGAHPGSRLAATPAPEFPAPPQNPLTSPLRASYHLSRCSPASPSLSHANAQRWPPTAPAGPLPGSAAPGLGVSVALTESERIALLCDHSGIAELMPWVFPAGERA